MEYIFALTLSHATEVGAIAAARAMGLGDKKLADRHAVRAMRKYLNSVEFEGTVVIGEGERDKAPMLYIGEKLGKGKRGKPKISLDIAVDPLENTNATARGLWNAISVLAASERGGLFHAPDMYMDKLVVGKEARGQVHLDAPVKKNLRAIAKALDREISDLVVVVLDRDRHEKLIVNIREAGARIKLIPDGDLSGGIAAVVRGTGVHVLMGIGAAPEGVMTAAAVRVLGGEMQARFWPKDVDEEKRLRKMGGDVKKIYTEQELAGGKNIVFAATGVTDGDLLQGVRFFGGGARTQTMVLSTQSGKIRFLDTTHVEEKEEFTFRLR
jgi:fructose-1,6-bisphosphatase II